MSTISATYIPQSPDRELTIDHHPPELLFNAGNRNLLSPELLFDRTHGGGLVCHGGVFGSRALGQVAPKGWADRGVHQAGEEVVDHKHVGDLGDTVS